MNIDVSEIKQFRHCKRAWQFSSRNSFHIAPVVTPKAFQLGTIFHESLHKLYLGKDIDTVCEYIKGMLDGEENTKDRIMLLSMIKGYDREVMPVDRERYDVLDIEYHFDYTPAQIIAKCGIDESYFTESQWQRLYGVKSDDPIHVCGSIDMIVVDKKTHEVWGFEHKTAKSFRKDVYLWLDEQPRLYYAALMLWIDEYNARKHSDWVEEIDSIAHSDYEEGFEPDYPPEPIPVTLGGVYINEVRKLVRAFETKRSTLVYPGSDLRNFMISLLTSVAECHEMVHNENAPRIPQPDFMACSMCQFNTICEKVQYADITLPQLLDSFGKDYAVRKQDHLEEKEEVDNEQSNKK